MKKLLFTAAVLTVFSGAYSAQALIPGVPVLETEVGYGYNGAKDGIHSAHIEISPVSKVIVGAEYRHWNHGGNETDIYAKYKLGHVYLGIAYRLYKCGFEIIMTETQKFTDFWKEEQMS